MPYFVLAAIVDFYIFRYILKHKPTIFLYIYKQYTSNKVKAIKRSFRSA